MLQSLQKQGRVCKQTQWFRERNGFIPYNICDTKYITLISLIHLCNAHNVCINTKELEYDDYHSLLQ